MASPESKRAASPESEQTTPPESEYNTAKRNAEYFLKRNAEYFLKVNQKWKNKLKDNFGDTPQQKDETPPMPESPDTAIVIETRDNINNKVEKESKGLYKSIMELLNKIEINGFNPEVFFDNLQTILVDYPRLYNNLKTALEDAVKMAMNSKSGKDLLENIIKNMKHVINVCFKGDRPSVAETLILDEYRDGGNDSEAELTYSIDTTLKEIEKIYDYGDNLRRLKTEIKNIFKKNGFTEFDKEIKSKIHTSYYTRIKSQGMDFENGRIIAMTYAIAYNIDIKNQDDLNAFIDTVQNGGDGKYAEQYREFFDEILEHYEDCIVDITVQSLIERYYAGNAVAEGRKFYENDFINFTASTTDGKAQSGLQVVSNIDNIDAKLNHYGFNNSNRSEHEEAALRYTTFDITFKNTFNLSNPIIEKLAAQQIDLRADLFSYGIYNQDDNYFNKDARDKYVTEKLQPIGFTPEEINELLRSMEQLPAEVEKNYKILSGNFDADHDSFEKIAKIYALGEVIDNIKKLFTRSESLSDNQKLSNLMGFKLDENKPADVVGDYLLLNGTVNGTKTKIKYDLRTGKLYMNALTQQEFNPPKITIGNDEPNTEIGDIGDFEDLLEGYQPTCFLEIDDENHNHNENYEHNASYGTDDIQDNTSPDNQNHDSPDDKNLNQKVLEKLVEDKLLGKLAIIGKTVQEKAGEQSKENVVIDEFLKTFNILPDDGNPGTIEFLGGSNLFILLESIKNTNDEDYLLKFSSLMSELMSFCGLTRGKNNLTSKEHGFDSITIFDIDEKNATQDIISLQRANKSFFSDTDGEKDKIKGCEAHFDSSVQLSFANIIVQKCCRRYGDGRKISANLAEDFVNQIQDGIKKVKHDEDDLIAINNIIDDDSTWA